MTKQPWEEKVVEDKDQSANRKTKGSVVSTPLLTGLLSVFFVIIVAILFVVFYTSNRRYLKPLIFTGLLQAAVSARHQALKHQKQLLRKHLQKVIRPQRRQLRAQKKHQRLAKVQIQRLLHQVQIRLATVGLLPYCQVKELHLLPHVLVFQSTRFTNSIQVT